MLSLHGHGYDPGLQRWLTPDPIGLAGGLNLYGFVGNNPVNFVDPYGLEVGYEYPAVGVMIEPRVNLTPQGAAGVGMMAATMVPGVGEAMDFAVLTDPQSSWFVRGVAIFSLAMSVVSDGLTPNVGGFIKGGKALCKDAATGQVKAFEVGTADDLLTRSVPGDKLDIHHLGQAHPLEQIITGYDRAAAPAITVPRAQHSTIPTVRGPYTGTGRDQLAKDVRDLRNYTDAPNSSLRELIDLSKQTFPDAFQK